MKKVILIFLCIALMLSVCACAPKSEPSGRTLFTFDGEVVKEEEFIFSFRNIITYFEGRFETGFSEMLDIEISDGVTLAQLCEEYALQEVGYAAVVRSIIKENSIPWGADNQDKYDTMMEYYISLDGGEAALEEKLKSNGMTLDMLKESVRQYVYLSAAGEYLFENGILPAPTENEIRAEFDGGYTKITTICFNTAGLSDKELDAIYIKVGSVKARYDRGESLEALMKEYGGSENGTYLINDGGSFDTALVTAAFEAGYGVLSEAKSENAYHVFIRELPTEEDFNGKYDEIDAALRDARLTKYIDTRYNEADFTVNEKLYDTIIENILSEY